MIAIIIIIIFTEKDNHDYAMISDWSDVRGRKKKKKIIWSDLIRWSDWFYIWLRCFEDGNITHVEGDVNPLRDIEIIETELIYVYFSIREKKERLKNNQNIPIYIYIYYIYIICNYRRVI